MPFMAPQASFSPVARPLHNFKERDDFNSLSGWNDKKGNPTVAPYSRDVFFFYLLANERDSNFHVPHSIRLLSSDTGTRPKAFFLSERTHRPAKRFARGREQKKRQQHDNEMAFRN